MAKIIFSRDIEGFRSGIEYEVGEGVADVYVNIRKVAVYASQRDVASIMTRDIPGPKDARRFAGKHGEVKSNA